MNGLKNKKTQRSILVVLIAVIIGHMAATQYFASKLGHQAQFLGQPAWVDSKSGQKLYWPHKIHVWSSKYKGGHIDGLIRTSWLICFGLVGSTIVVVVFLLLDKGDKTSGIHGNSRWATDEEIEDYGLTKDVETRKTEALKYKKPINQTASCIIGKNDKGELFYNWGKEHLLIFAPTRAGKGTGFVIPTLLTWSDSVLVLDIKGENFEITSNWRKSFSHIIYFNPTSRASARFNPLLEVRRGPNTIRDVMNISEILLAKPAGQGGDPFWDGGTKKVLNAAILHQLFATKDKHLAGVARQLSDIETMIDAWSTTVYDDQTVHEMISDMAIELESSSENVCSGWVNGAREALKLWRDPLVAQATCTSDFRLKDMQYAKNPISLYLVIPPSDLSRLGPLVRLLITQMTDVLTQDGVADENDKYRLLMLCDEFPQFGNMDQIEKNIGYTAGYGIKFAFITQGIEQLQKNYGRDHSFIAGCHTKLAYSANDPVNAKIVSDLAGQTTVFKEQVTTTKVNGRTKGKNYSKSEVGRPLITIGEAQQMEDDSLVLFQAGCMPIKAKKVTYYDDERFMPLFKGQQQPLPCTRLDDFPNQTVITDWGDVNEIHLDTPQPGEGLPGESSPDDPPPPTTPPAQDPPDRPDDPPSPGAFIELTPQQPEEALLTAPMRVAEIQAIAAQDVEAFDAFELMDEPDWQEEAKVELPDFGMPDFFGTNQPTPQEQAPEVPLTMQVSQAQIERLAKQDKEHDRD